MNIMDFVEDVKITVWGCSRSLRDEKKSTDGPREVPPGAALSVCSEEEMSQMSGGIVVVRDTLGWSRVDVTVSADCEKGEGRT